MRCIELFEDANDLTRVALAQKYAYAFTNWLDRHNTDTVLGEIDGFIYWKTTTHKGLPLHILSVPAWRVGLSLDDLSFGIAWTDTESTERGWLLAGSQDHRRHYFALLKARGDPRHETDVLWGLSTHTLVHEVIHYFDYKRGYNAALGRRRLWQIKRELETGKKPTEKYLGSLRDYYNDPLELNAHFQQALAQIFTSLASNIAQQQHYGTNAPITWLGTFADFYAKFEDIADRQKDQYLKSLTRRNKRKVVLRLYKLYTLIKRQWPNLPAIQQQAADFVQHWQERDAQHSASADAVDTTA